MRLPAHQIHQCGPGALVRHMRQLHAGDRLKQFAGEMRVTAGAGGRHQNRTGLGFRQRDEFLHGLHRQRRMRHQHHGRDRHHRGRHKIPDGVVGRLTDEHLVDGHGAGGAEQHRVAIGRRPCDEFVAQAAARTAAIFNHHRLPELLGQSRRHGTRRDIDIAAGCERHDQADGAVGIGGVYGRHHRDGK